MEGNNATPTGQPAPAANNNAKAEEGNEQPLTSRAAPGRSLPQGGENKAEGTMYTTAEVEKAVEEALTKAGLSAEALEKQKAEWETKLTEAKATIFNAEITGIAGKHGADAKALRDKVEELGISDPARVDALAVVMPKAGVKNDSGKTIGGHDFWKLPPEEQYRQGVQEERKRKS